MIGFFGGSFNPVHFGHLEIAKNIKQYLRLDELFLMPCSPVHKNELFFNNQQRLELLQLAIKAYPMLQIDDREIKNTKPTYTIDTLKKIKLDYPQKKIFFIMGADSYAQIDTWKDHQQLSDYAQLVVVARPKHQIIKNDTVIYVKDININISSSSIIQKLKANQSISGLMPKAVIKRIETFV
jgi:nicotinate-nucleotide adenylyltransferase